MDIAANKEQLFLKKLDEISELRLIFEREEEKFLEWIEKEKISDDYYERCLAQQKETIE